MTLLNRAKDFIAYYFPGSAEELGFRQGVEPPPSMRPVPMKEYEACLAANQPETAPMSDLFDAVIQPLVAREGGYVNNPNDSGGETIWGITKATARENGYLGSMQAMTREQAILIYRAKYWLRAGLHLLAPIDAKITEELFDTGVNMGVGTAGMFVQRALNVLNRQGRDYADIAVDGMVGAGTAAALTALGQKRPNGLRACLTAIRGLRAARYVELAERAAKNEEFELGWLGRVSL